ncbi:MAG TPA: dihydroorotase [Mangrovimonas sp.]|nr:dihydroorotase [Mangrovimonas sp.]
MNALLKSATIIDPKSEFHNTTQDILIENGIITQVSQNIKNTNGYKEIALENLHVSQGWFDSSVSFGEPGYEERETIENGLKTAAKSGFTTVMVNANTVPVTDTGSHVSFIQSKAKNSAVTLEIYGALTKGSLGEALAELYDMQQAGALAFYDYQKAISNANLMKIALQYAANFNGLICSFPQNNTIAGKGVVNEGITSTLLGLKGIPTLAEELQISRDLYLLEYTGGRLHIPTISSAKSVELIRDAKRRKLNVTCSVATHNLFFTDAVLKEFDSNYKVLPPLRTQDDINALIEGLKDGTIDMVTSDHNPLDIEKKKLEFDHADYGTIGLESAFGALNSVMTLKKTIETLTSGKTVFGIEYQPIKKGRKADLTLFNPNGTRTFTEKDILSKSKNSAFLGSKLKGVVYGIIAKNKLELNS